MFVYGLTWGTKGKMNNDDYATICNGAFGIINYQLDYKLENKSTTTTDLLCSNDSLFQKCRYKVNGTR